MRNSRVKIHLDVITPPLYYHAMCVYKFTLDTGFYYIGATTDLSDRINNHLKNFRNKKHSPIVMEAMLNAKTIAFEFLKFVNDKKLLNAAEQSFLLRNVGLPLCLNTNAHSLVSFKRGELLNKIVKLNIGGDIIKTYESITDAAVDNKISISSVYYHTKTKYTRDVILRRIDDNGNILVPVLRENHNVSFKKPVLQFDKRMNFIMKHDSYCDAARHFKTDHHSVSRAVDNPNRSCKGFILKSYKKTA